MIKIIEEKSVPRTTICCSNCNSTLEYGNADLHEDYQKDTNHFALYNAVNHYYFICPVCGCKVKANWITNK